MRSEPIPTEFYVLVAVRRNDQYVLVHERKHEQRWALPAGRVERGEGFLAAAKRETLEEAGIPITVTGIVKFEHDPTPKGTLVRLIVLADPVDETPPKSEPDDESLEAGWFTMEQITQIPLRNPGIVTILTYLDEGHGVTSVDILTPEGGPFF